MIRSEKRLKELALVLTRDNPLMIEDAIEVLRNTQPFEGAIGLLTSYFNRSDNSSIRKQITNFMNDLKDQAACREVMEEIKKEILPDTLRMLISSCWQSGLDYVAYSADFAGIFLLTDDYMTAIECFTVIESSVQNMTTKEKDEIIRIITEGSALRSEEMSALETELISVLK